MKWHAKSVGLPFSKIIAITYHGWILLSLKTLQTMQAKDKTNLFEQIVLSTVNEHCASHGPTVGKLEANPGWKTLWNIPPLTAWPMCRCIVLLTA